MKNLPNVKGIMLFLPLDFFRYKLRRTEPYNIAWSVMHMNRTKILIASAVFLLLTAIKLFVPSAAIWMREKAKEVLDYDMNYIAVFENISHKLNFGADEAVAVSAVETLSPSAQAKPLCLIVEEAESSGEADETPAEPEAVAAFLAAQAIYSAYDLPENVDYTYAPIPFPYTQPVSGSQSSGFGYRIHPIANELRFHYGTDVSANTGDSVCAFADGTVTFAGYCDSFGNYIRIDHGDGWDSLYAHCSALTVQTGASVTAGEEIAKAGATGLVTGPHLHFELRHDGIYINPEYYIGE